MAIVRDGTPNFTQTSLCRSCRNAHILEGLKAEDTHVFCHSRNAGYPPMRVTWTVTKCNDHENKATPTLWDMEKIAWRFSKDTRGGRGAGFLTPKEYKTRYPDSD
jgi:hypothetical protein